MGRNKIILASIFFAVVMGIFVVLQNKKTPEGLPPILSTPAEYTSPPPTPIFEYYKPTYTADGKIDTRDWVVYRDEEVGFSARAPKGQIYIGSTEDAYRIFLYTTNNKNDRLVMNMIEKKPASNLRNWIASYVSVYPEGIVHKEFVSIGKYEALQFDIEKSVQTEGKLVYFKNTPYYKPSNYRMSEQSDSFIPDSHNYVIEAGDRYLLIRYSLTENKSYIDTYNAIVASLEIFSPKKI